MRIKPLLGILSILVVFAAAAFGQSSNIPQGTPKMVMNKTEHNFGEIKRGAQANYSFVFKNEGSAELQIKNVTPGCGCTASDFTKSVAPGQEGKITLSVNTTNFNGTITKSAEVFTNDPQRERFSLLLSMVVIDENAPRAEGRQVGPFLLSPSDQSVLHVAQGMNGNGLITIAGATGQPIRITKATSGGEAFSVSLDTLSEGQRYVLNFTSSAKLPVGSHKQTVKLTTDSKERPELEIQLEAVVVNAVSVNPLNLIFENVPVSDLEADLSLVSKILRVRLSRGTGLEIKAISSDLAFIKTKKESTFGDGQMIILRVGFKERPPKGTHQGVLKIETNHPMAKMIEVPITVKTQ